MTLAVTEKFFALERQNFSTAAPFAHSLYPPQEALGAKLPIPPHPHIEVIVNSEEVLLIATNDILL